MVSLLLESRFYVVFMIQFSCIQVFLRDCLEVFRLKCLFYYFLYIFQNFEVIINSNALKPNCQAPVRRKMNEQSTNNGLNSYK